MASELCMQASKWAMLGTAFNIESLKDKISIVLLVVSIIFAVTGIFVNPVFNPYDETGHFVYIQELLHSGRIPSYLETSASFGCTNALVRHQCVSGSICYWEEGHWSKNEISIHSPLYYLLVSPIYYFLQGNICSAVPILRLVNLTFFLLTVGLIIVMFTRLFASFALAMVAGVWILTNPNLLARSQSITDDVLPALLFTFAVAIMLRLEDSPRPLNGMKSFLLGMLIGAGLIAKYTSYLMVPLLFSFWFWRMGQYLKCGHRQQIISSVFAAVLGLLLPVVSQILLNYHLYGAPFFTDMRGAMGAASRTERIVPFLQDPRWLYYWPLYYWLDSWTSFYDWTSGYVLPAIPNFKRYTMPMGRLYILLGVPLLVTFLWTLLKRFRTLRWSEALLLSIGLAAPLSKFVFDWYQRSLFPAIRFGFPYTVGIAFLIPFSFIYNPKLSRYSFFVLTLLCLLNIGQLSVGMWRNVGLATLVGGDLTLANMSKNSDFDVVNIEAMEGADKAMDGITDDPSNFVASKVGVPIDIYFRHPSAVKTVEILLWDFDDRTYDLDVLTLSSGAWNSSFQLKTVHGRQVLSLSGEAIMAIRIVGLNNSKSIVDPANNILHIKEIIPRPEY